MLYTAHSGLFLELHSKGTEIWNKHFQPDKHVQNNNLKITGHFLSLPRTTHGTDIRPTGCCSLPYHFLCVHAHATHLSVFNKHPTSGCPCSRPHFSGKLRIWCTHSLQPDAGKLAYAFPWFHIPTRRCWAQLCITYFRSERTGVIEVQNIHRCYFQGCIGSTKIQTYNTVLRLRTLKYWNFLLMYTNIQKPKDIYK